METENQPEEGQQVAATPEPNVAETPVKPEESGTQETPAAEGETEQQKKPRFQERISELVRQREEARRHSEYLLREVERLRGGEQKPTKPEGKPDPQKFESFEEYLDALSDWKVDQRLSKERESFQRQTAEQRQMQAIQGFRVKEEEAASKYEDYEAVTRDPNLPVTPAMAEAMMESDLGPDVWYFLGNNPKEAYRIANLSPASQIREIGKIEAKLGSSPAKTKVPAAPAPISPVNSGKSVSDPNPSDKDDIKTWVQKRNKQLGRS